MNKKDLYREKESKKIIPIRDIHNKKPSHGSWEKCLRSIFLTPVEGRRDR
jgi:hypothetical protein